ncbi:MAG: CBS domain-containing protein [Phycisphaerales bacterium]
MNISRELRIRDVMTVDPVCVSPSTTIRELARTLENNEISGAPVVDQEGRVVGVVSKTDLIRRCSEGTDELPPAYLFEVLREQGDENDEEVIREPLVCVEDFMTADPVTVPPESPASSAARLMCERRIHRLVVVDGDRFPIGIVTTLDLLEAIGSGALPAEARRQ